jgi:hypothetical protein
MNQSHRCRRRLLAGFFILGLLGLTACRTVPQAGVDPKEFSGFLGDYSALQKGGRGEANYIYINRSVNFARYTKVYVQPVALWEPNEMDSVLGRLSPQNQQMLVDYFHTALVDALQKEFQVVNYAGPDVLVVRAAITEARKCQPVPDLVSSTVPADMALGFAKQPITGTGAAVGLVMVEAGFMDGQTGRRVAAVVDARPGTKALRTKSNATWGEVKLAFDWWAQRLAARLHLLRQDNFSAETL